MSHKVRRCRSIVAHMPAHLVRVMFVARIGAQLSERVPVSSPRTCRSVLEKPNSATVGTVGRRSMHVPVVPSKPVAQPLVRSSAHADAHETRRDDAALVVRSAHGGASVGSAYDRSSSVGLAVPALAFPIEWEPTSGANSASPSSASSLLSPNGFHDVGDRWEDMEDLEDMPWSASELLNAARRVESARTQKASPLSVGRALSPTDTEEKTLFSAASERARSTSQLSGLRGFSSSPTTSLQSLSSSLCDRRRSSSARRASLSETVKPKNSADSLAEAKVWFGTAHATLRLRLDVDRPAGKDRTIGFDPIHAIEAFGVCMVGNDRDALAGDGVGIARFATGRNYAVMAQAALSRSIAVLVASANDDHGAVQVQRQ